MLITARAHCNACLQETKHSVLAHHTRREEDGEGRILGEIAYEIIECCGCESISMREHGDLTGYDFDFLYPARIARRLPEWRSTLPKPMRELLEEVYNALHEGSLRLSAMGARALFDMLAIDKVGDVGSFTKKRDALHTAGILSSLNRDVVAAAIDAGSATAHRGHLPSAWDVGRVMDILENVLQSAYVLGGAADWLRKRTPPREPTP